MIKDFLKIYSLISDLILCHHPITLDIRYLFCQQLNSKGECWGSREEWESYIKDGCDDHTLTEWLKILFTNKYFRKDVVKVLQAEKEKYYGIPK